jgi:hypothetical protein
VGISARGGPPSGAGTHKNKKADCFIAYLFEVWVGIEPTIRVLQTHALPLGDQTIFNGQFNLIKRPKQKQGDLTLAFAYMKPLF